MNDELAQRLTAIENRLGAIERLLKGGAAQPVSSTTKPAAPSLSVTEYILRLRPASDVERTMVLANFLEEYRHVSPFTSDDIANLFVEARLKKPANVADKIGKNISKGRLMPAGEVEGKKAWKLTLSGQQYIEELESGR